ncbi:MAG: DegQ family serine endoprotease [Steroidobacteraceae bacterium]
MIAPGNHKRFAAPGLALAILAAAVLVGCSGDERAAAGETPRLAGVQPPPAVPVTVNAAGLPDFSPLVDSFGPAVVNVSTVARATGRGGLPGLDPSDPMYEFFERFGFGMPRGPRPPVRGEGSGFLVSPDGYILTNAHVVEGASEVTIKMTDRREYLAEVVGIDERTDVAVLKVEASELPYVRLGDPDSLKVGEWVVAIGSPFGFENSVTAGIVSAKARSLPGDAYTPFIQTDVAVNPGNSGGPLFNLRGEVVGINSQIYSRTGGYQGVSFAIPIDVAVSVRDQLIEHGRVKRGRIGVTIQDVNQALADSFGLDRPRGALVSSVERKGPADEAGIRPGDVILGVGEQAVEASGDLPPLVAEVEPGTRVEFEIWRDGRSKRMTVEVGEVEEEGVAERQPASDNSQTGKLGLTVRSLSSNEQRRLETEGNLLVEEVEGPAALAGVEPGDVLIAVNGKPVDSLATLRREIDSSRSTVALLLQRGEGQIYVPVRIG